VDAKVCSEFENGMGGDVVWDVFVTFFLVANMDETMINTHFELSGRLVSSPLVFIELFETLECYKPST